MKVKWNGGSLVGVVILDKSHLNNVMTFRCYLGGDVVIFSNSVLWD